MQRADQNLHTWNAVTQAYQDKFMALSIYNESYDYFIESLRSADAQVLDIGCGPGNITHYLLSKEPSLKITGIDFAPNMIKSAQQNNPTATFEVLDGKLIGTLSHQFDGIICGFCIPYFSTDEIDPFLADCNKILQLNGILYLSFVEDDHSHIVLQTGSTGHSSYFQFYEKGYIVKALNNASFKVVETFFVEYDKGNECTEIHSIVIAKKH